ncbi:MAG: three-Cys-motif partner protein TcmP [Bacillota bacterium]|nr:three-Cys-motif partner protein TcmP [Bacillota bacterium]
MSGAASPRMGQWSKDKLSLLGQYLHAYSVIMSKQKAKWLQSYGYVDAFAGPGQYSDVEHRVYVEGSPRVALACEPPFDEFWFVERSPRRLDQLKQLVACDFPNLTPRVNFCHGDANAVLKDEILPLVTLSNHRRGFLFLDPYGLDVHFSTLQSVADAQTFDVFINFSVMGITRILEREDAPDQQTLDIVERVMGDSGWVDNLYWTQPTLFGEERSRRAQLKAQDVALQYGSRLRTCFPFVSEPVVMRNSKEVALYALVLASHNRAAANITNDIFRRYERLRGLGN